MTDETQELPIDPKLYQQTLETLHLQTVCLEEVHSVCDREALEKGGVTINIGDKAFARQTPTKYYAYIQYHLAGQQEETVTLRLDARYCMIFETETPIPPGFFDVFRVLNLKMTTLPYFRELVASVTGRMELPTLTIPYNLFIPATSGDEQAEVEEDKNVALLDNKGRKFDFDL